MFSSLHFQMAHFSVSNTGTPSSLLYSLYVSFQFVQQMQDLAILNVLQRMTLIPWLTGNAVICLSFHWEKNQIRNIWPPHPEKGSKENSGFSFTGLT
jgi:hypothetical protein